MNIAQSIESAREEHIGSNGINARELDAALIRAEGALDWLRARHADRSLPLLRLPEARSDLENIRDTARQLADRATDIVILGTGGSSLGGQTLAQLAGYAVAGIRALGVPPRYASSITSMQTLLQSCSRDFRTRPAVSSQFPSRAARPRP
jgi:glucose-6-phosphate isomerase